MVTYTVRKKRQAQSLPPSLTDGGIPMKHAMMALMKSLRLDDQAKLGRLESDWERLAGKPAANHTRPGPLNNGELVIFVDNSMWLSELHRKSRGQLLQSLQQAFGPTVIRSIRLQLDPGR